MRVPRPFLKWAGGKTQLLDELCFYVPEEYGKYIEPMVGGGAFFFHLEPEEAVLSDMNEELITAYRVVRDDVEELIEALRDFENEKEFYYAVRAQDPAELSEVEQAARMIYLNKTCFNGLYRVNKKGEFNVPFGRRKNPTICDEENLRAVHEALQDVTLVHGDYKSVLDEHASRGDFVYLDPPYHPAEGYAEFKRYTRDFFYEEDHITLRDEFVSLVEKGCWVLLTNRNVEPVRELYRGFDYEVVETRRNISSKASSRGEGEDLIVVATHHREETPSRWELEKEDFLGNFPGTRFMGSKYRVLPFIWDCVEDFDFDSVLDAFSGSGCVSYMFKRKGKRVISNDYLHFAYHIAKATVENGSFVLRDEDIALLMQRNFDAGSFISETFKGLYFTDDENDFLDSLRANIDRLDNPYRRSLALAAISRACLKRRPRGVFTYVGDRYDDGRRDLQMTLQEHFLENVEEFNSAVFDNGMDNKAMNDDVFDLDVTADVVYLDPPYYSTKSDNNYVRRYHFVEGYVRQWTGLEIEYDTKTNKFKRYDTPFGYKRRVYQAFEWLFGKFRESILVVSYSSNSIPHKEELVDMLKEHKSHVRVHQVEHLYSFGTHGHKVGNDANRVMEYVFVAY